jgi:uncharacterized membrane protein
MGKSLRRGEVLDSPPREGSTVKPMSRLDKALSIVLAFSILAAIGILAYTLATHGVREKFTEFYLLDSQGMTEDYPQKLLAGQPGEVILAIRNHEQQDTYYYVEVRLDGTETQRIGPIRLAHEKGWEGDVTFVPTKAGKQRVEFQLYKEEGSEPYRDLYLWLDVGEAT